MENKFNGKTNNSQRSNYMQILKTRLLILKILVLGTQKNSNSQNCTK
jgi:hypothetical protein